MANNRLYLYDPENNTAVMVAKTFGSGWQTYPGLHSRLQKWFDVNPDFSNMEPPRYLLMDEYSLPDGCVFPLYDNHKPSSSAP
jgi:hypothetical protein